MLLEPLENGKPRGSLYAFIGNKFVFSGVLSMAALDDFIPPLPVVEGHADSFDVWRVIVSQILKAEGL